MYRVVNLHTDVGAFDGTSWGMFQSTRHSCIGMIYFGGRFRWAHSWDPQVLGQHSSRFVDRDGIGASERLSFPCAKVRCRGAGLNSSRPLSTRTISMCVRTDATCSIAQTMRSLVQIGFPSYGYENVLHEETRIRHHNVHTAFSRSRDQITLLLIGKSAS